jgi:branched-chain amino acid transport system ATP-binding protein
MPPVLEVSGLEAAYGSSQVLFGIDLAIGKGETATLLGRNGMGKTTTVRAMTGALGACGGSVRFLGERIDGLGADRIARMGMALVPEGRMVFANLSVEENLLAFAGNRSRAAAPWSLDAIYELFPPLRQRRAHGGGQLSGGEQQMVAIGRALMTNPHLLILDEATEGLAPLIREDIWRCLAALRRRGQAILVIDKYVRRLIELADHHTLIERGRVVWQGTSSALAADPTLWHRYVGV